MKLPPLKPDSDQMLHLDALRIVGAVMIVVFHFNRFINLDGRWQVADDTVKSFSLIVDLFFLISGYVMAAIYTGRLTTAAKPTPPDHRHRTTSASPPHHRHH